MGSVARDGAKRLVGDWHAAARNAIALCAVRDLWEAEPPAGGDFKLGKKATANGWIDSTLKYYDFFIYQ